MTQIASWYDKYSSSQAPQVTWWPKR